MMRTTLHQMAKFSIVLLLAGTNVLAGEEESITFEDLVNICVKDYSIDSVTEDNGSLRSWFLQYGNQLCPSVKEAAESSGENAGPNKWDKLKTPLTEERLQLIMDQEIEMYVGGDFVQECWVNDFEGTDDFCITMRKKLHDKDMSMSQDQFNNLKTYCQNKYSNDEILVRPCMDDWITKRWIMDGVREIPVNETPGQQEQVVQNPTKKTEVGGKSFDDFMSVPTPADNSSSLSGPTSGATTIDDLMADSIDRSAENPDDFMGVPAPSASESLLDGDMDFDSVYAGREQIRIDGIKQELFDKGERIASACQCAFNQTACFEGYNFAYDQLNQAMSQGRPQFESEMDHICMTWTSNLRGATSDDEELLNRYLRDSDSISSSIDKLHKEFDEFNSMLAHKAGDLDRAKQQQQQAQSGFQWGKFAALGAGTVIGASMSDLTGADTIEILSNVALDSMAGVEGANNTMQGMDSITQRHLEELEAERSIRQQQQAINTGQQAQQQQPVPAAQTNQSAYNYDDLLASNNVQQQPASTVSSTSGGRGPWGAIAFARDKSRNNYGFVVNKSSREEALQAALSACGSNCSYQTSGGGSSDTAFKDFCAAVYLGTLSGGAEYRHFFGYDRSSTSAAESDAGGSCSYNRKVHNPGMTCQFITSGCSGN